MICYSLSCLKAQSYSYVPFPDSNANWYSTGYIRPMNAWIPYNNNFFY